MACSSTCRSGDHNSYGECLRAKNLKTAYMQEWKGKDATAQKRADKALDAYESARSQGIQPKTTRLADTQRAVDMSDKTGSAYRA